MHKGWTDSPRNILVTGIGGPAGKCASSYLANCGYTVIGTDMRSLDSDVAHCVKVPAAEDAAFVPALLKVIEDFHISMLIPTVSEELPIIAGMKDSFSSLGCHVMIAPHQAIDIANDKLKTALFLDRHGVEVPLTVPGDIAHAHVIQSIGLPVIAKPRISRGGRGVVLYNIPEALVLEHRGNIVYQKFMSGEEYDVNLYVNHKGKIQSCVVLHKTSLREGIVGNAISVKRVQREDIVELCTRAVKVLGITGPADIDIRDDASGKPHLLEINARLGANALSASEVLDDLVADWKSTTHYVEGIS